MTDEREWLAVPDVAARLDVPLTRVREMLRERELLAVRRGDNSALYLPADMLVEVDGVLGAIPTLRGTLTLLGDAGFADDAAMEWLLEHNDELEESPLAALRSGKRAHVRRIAQAML